MKFCHHDWHTWKRSNPNPFKALGSIGASIIFTALCFAFLHPAVGFFIGAPIITILGMNFIILMDTGDAPISFKLKDKTCVKCKKNVFAASLREKRKQNRIQKKNNKQIKANALENQYKKSLTMRLKAED